MKRAEIAEWAKISPNGPDLYIDRRDLIALARQLLAVMEENERLRAALVAIEAEAMHNDVRDEALAAIIFFADRALRGETD